MSPTTTRLPAALVAILATATGIAVANMYYAQPLLPAIGSEIGLPGGAAGLIVTLSQLGYAAGLVLLLPLGDLLERRRLVCLQGVGAAVALTIVGSAPSSGVLLPAAVLVGLFAVQAQTLVPLAASLASDDERGRVVGGVMSGLLLGILLARTVAGYVAELGTWRLVYFVAAVAMLLQSLVLWRTLPRSRADSAETRYGALLRSIPAIVREYPVLRLRAVYGAVSMGAFSVLWTSIAFLLSGSPYHYGSGTIGLFGLAGAAGALAATVTGRLTDRGYVNATTAVSSLLLAVSWLAVLLGDDSIAWLLVGIVGVDMGVQGVHLSNQSEIYRLAPEARSRINSAYMTAYFAGGALGSAASAAAWDSGGWSAVCAVGGAFGLATALVWVVSRARAARSRPQPAG